MSGSTSIARRGLRLPVTAARCSSRSRLRLLSKRRYGRWDGIGSPICSSRFGSSSWVKARFRAPASLGRTNLPVQPTLFVGRVRELEEALGLLHRSHVRLLTLTGAGGSGKTRL